MIRKILQYPNENLRTVCKEVTVFGKKLQRDSFCLLRTLENSKNGVGLAANQIGFTDRIIALKLDDFHGVMVNPEIVHSSEDTTYHTEGCLSFDNGEIMRSMKVRAEEVQVRWQDVDGEDHEAVFIGLSSICIQHEVDHLNGVVFTDYDEQALRITE